MIFSNISSKLNSFILNRRLRAVKRIPRFKRSYIDIFDIEFEFIDSASFFFQFQEIFKNELYKFNSEKPVPYIIDCGANIGLSILYFKRLYKDCRIVAFEPDPYVFSVLKCNIKKCKYNNVELINKAVWKNDDILKFISDGSDGGRIASKNENIEKSISIQSVSLSSFLDEDIDLLKLDIEGAETIVLQSCAKKLDNIKNIFVEYHSFANEKQSLGQLLDILSTAKFRIYINPISFNRQPFLRKKNGCGIDMQLNIFGIRQ